MWACLLTSSELRHEAVMTFAVSRLVDTRHVQYVWPIITICIVYKTRSNILT